VELAMLLVPLGLLIAAAVPYLLVEPRWRWRWREVEAGRVAADDLDGGIYRASGTVPTYLRGAPARVRFAAYTCLLFGQMFVPGLLVGAFGLLAGGIGLVSIPGLITAAKLYRTGLLLLRREPREAYFAARNAAAWALWLNGLIMAASFALLLTPLRPTSEAGLGLFLLINGYGFCSIVQALFVRSAVDKFEDALFAPSQLISFGNVSDLRLRNLG
jgi:hypothetical protein